LTNLVLHECTLAAGTEWKEPGPGWKVVLVSKGFLYWIARDEVRELNADELLILSPVVDGVLRASQISPVELRYLHLQAEDLMGLMSFSERLSAGAGSPSTHTRILSAQDPIAREFAGLAGKLGKRRDFSYRCRILNLVGMIFGEALPEQASRARATAPPTLLRFEEILSRIPDADLIHYSAEKLATMCGCSLRHFRRMFRKQYQTSVRARQTELRLEKARRLLEETDDKITSIAQAVGYRHMGFFNMMFKKRFGFTPSECRRRGAASGQPAPAPVSRALS